MTQGRVHVTDYTNASRTMLFNINTLSWDQKLLDELGIPASMMPEVKRSSEVYGQTNIGGKGGTRIPIAGIAGDQQAALYGQMCVEAGQAKKHLWHWLFLINEYWPRESHLNARATHHACLWSLRRTSLRA
ncbi:FGGY family carbohydrate kinase [Vibrio sinaloensis]|nr:FGGY family carbohydrate kinase [Vibrio sinaloensis]